MQGKWTGSFPGFGYGGTFTTTSHLAAGVLGINEATEAGGSGVIGIHEHTTGAGYGVRGETASAGGHGVRGENGASGNHGSLGTSTAGVLGVSADGTGVRGENSDSGNYGLLGCEDGGVYGYASCPVGLVAYGVYGKTNCTTEYGYAVWGVNEGSNTPFNVYKNRRGDQAHVDQHDGD